MKINFIENDIVQCWQEDGILYGVFKISTLDVKSAMIAVATRTTAAKNVPMLFVVDARQVKSINKEARDYLASEKGTHNIIANSLIVESGIGKFLGNFFLRINKPKVPLRLFTDYDEAILWLQSKEIPKPQKGRMSDLVNQ